MCVYVHVCMLWCVCVCVCMCVFACVCVCCGVYECVSVWMCVSVCYVLFNNQSTAKVIRRRSTIHQISSKSLIHGNDLLVHYLSLQRTWVKIKLNEPGRQKLERLNS